MVAAQTMIGGDTVTVFSGLTSKVTATTPWQRPVRVAGNPLVGRISISNSGLDTVSVITRQEATREAATWTRFRDAAPESGTETEVPSPLQSV